MPAVERSVVGVQPRGRSGISASPKDPNLTWVSGRPGEPGGESGPETRQCAQADQGSNITLPNYLYCRWGVAFD